MKRSRFTEEQIIAVLREQEAGVKTADVCRKHGVSEATFYIYGRLSLCKRFKDLSDQARVPTSIRRRRRCWRAQMGNPQGMSLDKWSASEAFIKARFLMHRVRPVGPFPFSPAPPSDLLMQPAGTPPRGEATPK
jgi:hypothetical protein